MFCCDQIVCSDLQKSIVTVLLSRAIHCPERIALWIDDKPYTVFDIACRVVSVADFLQSKSFPTKSLALCTGNSADFVAVFLGANLLGLNVQVFNTDWPERVRLETKRYLQPDIFISDPELCDVVDDISIRDIICTNNTTEEFNFWIDRVTERSLTADAFYTGFTSGSTGIPKGFMRTEQSWLDSFALDETLYNLSPCDTIVCPGSFAHSLFLYALLRGIHAGIPVVANTVFKASTVINAIQKYQNVVLFAVPTQLQNLTDRLGLRRQFVTGVRLALSSGAKLQGNLKRSLATVFPKAEVAEFYGSSELGYISMAMTSSEAPAQSVGRPVDKVVVRIFDEKMSQCGQGQPGRIFVNSPLRFLGYAGQSGKVDLSNVIMHDGFMACGDTGYMDEQGYLYINGRTDRMMIVSGRNCYPENIEEALVRYTGIKSAAVFARSDSLRGTRPVAVVCLETGITVSRREIVKFAAEYLPNHEIPRRIHVQNHWPLTVSHKTDLQTLEKQLNQGVLEKLR